MLAQVWSAALDGVDSFPIRVEVNVVTGLPAFSVVGLPHGSVREGRDRVLTALRHHGLAVPPRRIVVNLAPADVRKEGSALDLPIAVGLLVGTGRVSPEAVDGWAFVGELGLDGVLRPLRGGLALAEGCRRAGLRAVAVPRDNAPEAEAVGGIEVAGIRDLPHLLEVLEGADPENPQPLPASLPGTVGDIADVRGQEHAKRAMEIAAAGGHHALLVGPPGVGKSMLASRLPGLLPPLSRDEALEVTRIQSVAGVLGSGVGLVRYRPFRAPHHTVSSAGLLGGGIPPRPGEISLAHNGVLFLDELGEFQRPVLEGLRQPLEEGAVRVARARHSVTFPSRIQMIGAMNPCPCGYYGDGSDRCTCPPSRITRYRSRASGPLLDRMDLHVHVVQPPAGVLVGDPGGPTSPEVRERVSAARARQAARYAGQETGQGIGQDGIGQDTGQETGQRATSTPASRTNAGTPLSVLMEHLHQTDGARTLITGALARLRMSARAYHRVLRVSRTIADLDGAEQVTRTHVAEAIQYRALDRVVL